MTLWRKLSLLAIAVFIAHLCGMPLGSIRNHCAQAYPYQFSVWLPVDRCWINTGAGWVVVRLP